MKRRILLVLFLLGISSAACLWASQPEGMDETAPPEKIASPAKPWTGIRLKGNGYTIQNLYDWERLTSEERKELGKEVEKEAKERIEGEMDVSDQINLALLSPLENQEDAFRENINIIIEKLPEGTTEQEYFRSVISMIQQIVGSDTKIGPYKPVLIGKTKGWKNTFQWTVEDKLELKQDSYVLLKDGMVYVITCSAEADRYDTWQPKFKAMIGTFRYVKKE